MSRDKQTSEKSMYDLILLGWSTVDVNANQGSQRGISLLMWEPDR